MLAFLLCVVVGIAMIILTAKGYSSKPTITYIIGGLFIIAGIMLLLFDQDFIVGRKDITVGLFVFSYSIAGIFLMAIIITMKPVFVANKKIKGKLISKNAIRHGLFPLYTLTFSYSFEKRKYIRTTSDTVGLISSRKLENGKEYNIYVGSKKPEVMVYKRRPGIGSWCMIIMFFTLILIPIIYMRGI